MSASISTKSKSVNLGFLKTAGKYVKGGVLSYIDEALPTTTSMISDTKSAYSEAKSLLANTTQSIIPKKRELSLQRGFKSVISWFEGKQDEFEYGADAESFGLNWDDGTTGDSFNEVEAQISEFETVGKNISSSVVESAHQLANTQIEATANISASIDKETSAMIAGFNHVNSTLDKILEVVTKNSAALIEATTANAVAIKEQSDANNMIASGKFNFSDYKKIVSGNINNSQLGMILPWISMLSNKNMISSMITPENVMSTLIGGIIDKSAPNLKKNMKALDDAVNDTIVSSLIRIGQSNSYTTSGMIKKIFGISSVRESVDTSRSSLQLKSIPFDSLTKEAITNTIPGYLRKILVAVGGEDVVYDYQGRKFITKSAVKKEFRANSTYNSRGSIYSASSNIAKAMGNMDDFTSMSYDLMINELGRRAGRDARDRGSLNNTISSFRNLNEAKKYVLETLYGGKLKGNDIKKAEEYAKKLNRIPIGFGEQDLQLQVAKANATRNANMKKYVEDKNAYNMDLSFIEDSIEADAKYIKKSYGRGDLNKSSSSVRTNKSLWNEKHLSGINYTNIALYEIYRKLNEGINVFQTGKNNIRKNPYTKHGDQILPSPFSHNAKTLPDNAGSSSLITGISSSSSEEIEGQNNLLQNNTDENGVDENLSKGQRFGRWGKRRGSQLVGAMFKGSPEEVKQVFGDIVKDVSQVSGDALKHSISKIDQSFGNITGFIKHKLFGTEYSYQTGIDDKGNPIYKNIIKNKNGGMFGWISENLKDSLTKGKDNVKKWYNDVASYFDYSGHDPEEKKIEGKRRKLLTTSIGAFAGAGLLGGPIGLLVGSIAGNALSITGFGKNIKEKLFGIDKETGKSTGLLSKAFDKVTRPIQYQFEKSISFLGGALKKGLLGPISDIGFAIKNRIADTASSVFGGFFKKIVNGLTFIPKKIIQGIGWAGGKLFDGVVGAKGTSLRAKLGLAEELGSGVLGTAAYALGGRKQWEAIHQRRKERAESIKEERKSFGNYKDWSANKNRSRAERLNSLDSYAEEIVGNISQNTSEITEDIKKQAENSSDISQNVTTLTTLASEAGSLFTHDQGLHDRLDSIIELLGGKPIGKRGKGKFPSLSTDTTDDEFAGAAITAATTLAVSGDSISSEESRLTTSIIDESNKPKKSKQSISQKLKELMGAQKKFSNESNAKKESFMEKLLSGISSIAGNLPLILAAAAGLWALFKNGGIPDALSRIAKLLENLGNILDSNDGTDAQTDATNAITSLGDVQADSFFDWVLPGANLYHNEKDGNNNYVTNVSATEAKETALWKANLASTIATGKTIPQRFQNFISSMNRNKAMKYNAKAQDAISKGNNLSAKWYNKKYQKYMDQAEAADMESASYRNTNSGSLLKTIGKGGIIYGASNILGWGAGKIANAAGVSDEGSQVVNNAITGGSTILMITHEIKSAAKGKQTMVDKVVEGLGNVLKTITTKVAKSKLGKKIGADKVISALENFDSKIINAVKTKITDKIIAKMNAALAKLGLGNILTVSTAGLAVIAGAVAGMASGYCSTEHLFGVAPGNADAGMKTISTVLEGAFSAIEMTAAGWIIAILDIIDGLVTALPGVTYGIKSGLAQLIYNLFNKVIGKENTLEEKQIKMNEVRENYNEKYGTNMNTKTFNDFANNTGFFSRWIHGKATVSADNQISADDAGNLKKEGGLISSLFGNDAYYQKDKNGNVIRDSNGNAILATSKYGDVMKKNMKAGDYFKIGVNHFKRSIFGGEVYKTDENGRVVLDENGNPVVDYTENNIISKICNNESLVSESLQEVVNYNVQKVSNFQKALDSYLADDVEKDENGNPILGDDGKPVKKSGIGKFALSILNKTTASLLKPFQSTSDAINEWNSTGEDGLSTTSSSSKSSTGSKDWIKDTFSAIMKGAGTALQVVRTSGFKFGIGGPDEEEGTSSTQKVSEGGNPLNKAYRVSSPYGPRTYPHTGNHRGVDLTPLKDDGTPTYVGSRFNGTITGVKSNVPDSDTATYNGSSWSYNGSNPTGNMITITTDDGLIIKNMHLKAGTIPSNIKVGAKIKIGDKIGEMGSTGWSTGPHLHYQFEEGEGNYIDPTSSVAGGSLMSMFKSSSSSYLPAATSAASSSSSDSSSTGTSGGLLSSLISSLSNAGNAFLSAISGGLIGSTSNGDTESAIISLDQNGTMTSSSSSLPTSPTETFNFGSEAVASASEQDVWNYLTKLGYNDVAKAGIMGVWAKETSNRNDRLEGDYMKSFPGFDSVLKDSNTLNNYTTNTLFKAYDKGGLNINKSAYIGTDGNYYPGIGIAQWTGPRGYNLFKYAKEKGMNWKNMDAQMEFFNKEMTDGTRGIYPNNMNSQSTVSDAAKLFANKYEGTSRADWISERQKEANRIYASLGNKNPTDAAGGPELDDNYTARILKSKINNLQKTFKLPSITNKTVNNGYNTTTNASSDGTSINMDMVVTLLKQVISELETISGNTGESTSLLGKLRSNDKTSGTKVTKTYRKTNISSNPNNSRMIASMARP